MSSTNRGGPRSTCGWHLPTEKPEGTWVNQGLLTSLWPPWTGMRSPAQPSRLRHAHFEWQLQGEEQCPPSSFRGFSRTASEKGHATQGIGSAQGCSHAL
eukprot:1133454-Pelagomonas_calceolata.AAC.2